MGFFSRIANLWTGFLNLWISDLEKENPRAVYEARIAEMIKTHVELKDAVSNLVYLRNKSEAEYTAAATELKQVIGDLATALKMAKDDAALALIKKKKELEGRVGQKEADLDNLKTQVDQRIAQLNDFKTEIKKLKVERDRALADLAMAEGVMDIQEQIDGISLDADIQALEGVREHIQKRVAASELGEEMSESSIDRELKAIRAASADNDAQAELDEMKRQLSAELETEPEGHDPGRDL
jgi:phage shock protein A